MSIYAIKLKNWHPIHTKRIDMFKSTLPFNASWQQRVIALANVKGIEI